MNRGITTVKSAMNAKNPSSRTRYLCRSCQQRLGYSAFRRHQDFPHLYCSGHVTSIQPSTPEERDSDSDSSDGMFTFDTTLSAASLFNSTTDNDMAIDNEPQSDPVLDEPQNISLELQSSDESDSAPEVWDTCSSESESESEESHTSTPVRNLQYVVCLFLAFFQLCFRISDKALVYLLSFLCALFKYLCSHVRDAPFLVAFAKTFPTTLYSLRTFLKLESVYVKYVVCPKCHKLYKESQCWKKGLHGVATSLRCNHIQYPNHPQRVHRRKCGAELMKKVKLGRTYKLVPRKVYIYYSIFDALQRLAMRPDFFEQCELWRKHKHNVPSGFYTDVFHGTLWSEWIRKDGVPFLEVPGNLFLMLNIDWFQTFEHTQYSVGVIYLVIQNLPRAVRFRAENVIIVSTIPGPNEPDCNHLNSYLEPLVNDLIALWHGVEIKTPHAVFSTKVVRAALGYISCDLPATRKLCGFYGYHANYGCSKCLKAFPSTFGSSPDYSGFDRNDWRPRVMSSHRSIANRAKSATTRSGQEKIEHEACVRYSELLRLSYFDVVRCHLVDPMHNLFLGTSKRMLSIWKEKGFLDPSKLEKLQEKVDSINPPANVGRIPGKISAGFAGFTAEQLMLWTVVYSPVVLRDLLPHHLYMHWCIFSKACALLCRPYIHKAAVDQADELLLSFCVGFEQLYGKDACTPNLHLHCHLKECILDVGPLYSFWCFSFERYNGLLEKMKMSWHSPEVQLIHKFTNLQSLAAVILPENIPGELMHCFQQAKDYKTAVPDPVIVSLAVLNSERYMMCLPQDICALKLPCHCLCMPGREKFMIECDREALLKMYTALYGAENVDHVPLRYTQFIQVQIFEQTYTSAKSRTSRSSGIIATWPYLAGILTSRPPSMNDVRVGFIQYFLLHKPCIKSPRDYSHQTTENSNTHFLACVKWLQDHPQKFVLGNGTILSATVTDHVSFMPVSRIISRCAVVDTSIQFDYGEDKVCIAIPVRRHFMFYIIVLVCAMSISFPSL